MSNAGSTPRPAEAKYANVARAFPPPPPPPPVADDFEDTPVGQKAALAVTHEENSQAVIRVTDETAAHGKHSLKFTDASGQQQRFNPHLYYVTDYRSGRLHAQFSLRQERGAILSHQWRDNESPYHVGPNLAIAADGTLTAARQAAGHDAGGEVGGLRDRLRRRPPGAGTV